jgi:hypothetical protein
VNGGDATNKGVDDSDATNKGVNDSDATNKGVDGGDATNKGVNDDSDSSNDDVSDSDSSNDDVNDSDATKSGVNGGNADSKDVNGGDATSKGVDDSDATNGGMNDSDATNGGMNDSDATNGGMNDSDATNGGMNDSDATNKGMNDSDAASSGLNDSNANNDNANNSLSPIQLTNAMIEATRGTLIGELSTFLEKMQQGEVVNMEQKIKGDGTPLGSLCVAFIYAYTWDENYRSTGLLIFDYLLSKGASLNGTIPSGQTILEYASKKESRAHRELTERILKNKDKIYKPTIKKAYEDAKAKNHQKIVKLFNDVGINDQNIDQL